jgi:YaiO family outer membrane protein
VLVSASAAAADEDGWTLDVAGDRAAVALGDLRSEWWTGRAQLGFRRAGEGGAFAAVESLRRFGATDTTFIAAGWRHAGPWSAYLEAGATPRADFHYRRSAEVEVFRRVKGPWVAHAAARLWAYPEQAVRMFSPRLTRYGGRSEVHARLYLVRNTTTGTSSRAALVRGHYDLSPRLRLGVGAAKGERIFDVTALPRDPAPGWVAFAEVRAGIGSRDSLGLLVRVAEEGSSFDQTAIGLAYRRSF